METHIPDMDTLFCAAINKTFVKVCGPLQDVATELLCYLEADTRDLADLVVVHKKMDIVVRTIFTCVWWQQCSLIIRLVQIAYQLCQDFVSRNTNSGSVALF